MEFNGTRFVRGDPEYYAARKDFNLRINKFPYIIVFAQNTPDVINAVRWARRYCMPSAPGAADTIMRGFR
jgi:hypothetical protein